MAERIERARLHAFHSSILTQPYLRYKFIRPIKNISLIMSGQGLSVNHSPAFKLDASDRNLSQDLPGKIPLAVW